MPQVQFIYKLTAMLHIAQITKSDTSH